VRLVCVYLGRLHEKDRVIRDACDEKFSVAVQLMRLSVNIDNDDDDLALQVSETASQR